MRLAAARAAAAGYPPLTLWIAGRAIPAEARVTETVRNPATGEALGELPHANDADLDAALQAASAGFEIWRRTAPIERARVLRRAADLLRVRREAMARLIVLELGKPINDALRESDTACDMFDWAAEEARRGYGRLIPARSAGYRLMAVPEPFGPVAAFSGWNAPSITPARKLSGALAAGCSIVIKPSEATPATALMLAQALAEAGIPEGVVNMVFGDPAAIAERLLTSPVIRVVSFTGATAIGRQIGAMAAATMKKAILELGGHAPVVVAADADPVAVARSGVLAKFRSAGQICTAPTRFHVHASIFPSFAQAFVAAARELRVGDPFDPTTQMGPLQNTRRAAAIERMVEDCAARGARPVLGGHRLDGPGNFYAPTVIVEPPENCLAMNEEPFGPLALLAPIASLEEGIAAANRLPFGLAAYGFTRELATAERLSSEIEAGNVVINHWVVSWAETPFGGVRDSGLGYEGGIEGVQAFQRLKFVSQAG